MKPRADLRNLLKVDAGLIGLREFIAKRLSQDPGHDLAHATRVALWTVQLGNGEFPPRDGIAAALCHDLVNLPKNSPNRVNASALSAKAATRILPRFGFGDVAVALIADAIRDHSYSRGAVPTTPLGRALQDADRLDALGSIGIMRAVSTATRMGAKYFDPEDPWAARRPLDDIRYSVDHFFKKLLVLPDTMCTGPGRAEARRRTRIMSSFLDELALEIGNPRP